MVEEYTSSSLVQSDVEQRLKWTRSLANRPLLDSTEKVLILRSKFNVMKLRS